MHSVYLIALSSNYYQGQGIVLECLFFTGINVAINDDMVKKKFFWKTGNVNHASDGLYLAGVGSFHHVPNGCVPQAK